MYWNAHKVVLHVFIKTVYKNNQVRASVSPLMKPEEVKKVALFWDVHRHGAEYQTFVESFSKESSLFGSKSDIAINQAQVLITITKKLFF